MEATTCSNFRRNLKKYMEKVNDDSEPLIVTNKEDRNIVVMSQIHYDNMVENMYVFGNAANRRHIDQSLSGIERGESIDMNLEDM